jgi:hypothetical protein
VNVAVVSIGVGLFAVGLAVTFAGVRSRPRVLGLAGMAAGALVVLVASDPSNPTVWAVAVTTGATLAGLVWFATLLARWAAERGEGPATLDDELV